MSLALARKYRPATFDDLIGQESVSQTLSLALDGNRLSHAYLFSGLRGSGKTSTARIFAKALLCEKGETSHPCGVCGHCVMAGQSRHLDIIEMDAASNRGIDDIKDLIEHTKYKPSSARYKIFIIDEVHMLTPQAFNALLKTLEEPPSFVKFILATTDPLKLPATILSRTQHFRFKKIPQNLVLKHLEHILELENIGYEIEALDIIARSGAGSLRDSLTLLDQAIVYSKNFVDVNTITGMLGIIEPSQLEALIADIMNKDIGKILRFITIAGDYESEMILDELTLYLKELLLSGQKVIHHTIIERFFRVIAESKGLLALGSDGEFVLSLALFKMVECLDIKDIDTMIKGLEQELSGVEIAPASPVTPITVSTPQIQSTATNSTHNRFEAIIDMVRTLEAEVLGSEIPTPTPIATQIVAEKVVIEKVISEEPIPQIEKREEKQSDEPPFENPFGEDEEEILEEVVIEEKVAEIKEEPVIKEENSGVNTFLILRQKLYTLNTPLGEAFERNITFESFQDHTLTWTSTAEDDDKKMLIASWGMIKNAVQEAFGIETKIVNISKKKMTQ